MPYRMKPQKNRKVFMAAGKMDFMGRNFKGKVFGDGVLRGQGHQPHSVKGRDSGYILFNQVFRGRSSGT
jgi:hypothetical protein